MKRREFLALGAGLGAAPMPAVRSEPSPSDRTRAGRTAAVEEERRFWREAAHYQKLAESKVECRLCPRRCQVSDQENGWCGVRFNERGSYYTTVFGRPVTIANDPVEKKPLFHFLPGTLTLSLATAGCNFECLFCQNWEISQFRPEQVPARHGFVSPDDLTRLAQRQNSRSISFTYSEPVVFFEYALATARVSKAAGIPGVMISNGWIEAAPMDELLKELGAVKIDFKAFDPEFYQRQCRGTLEPVLATMERIRKSGVWLELVHLTIPTLNDDPEQARRLCGWVLEKLGPDVPVHFTRFHPTYKLRNLPPTPPAALERQYDIARKAGLRYVYVGNLPGHEGENTRCHSCREMLIRRVGFTVLENRIRQGKCPKCGEKIPGVWG